MDCLASASVGGPYRTLSENYHFKGPILFWNYSKCGVAALFPILSSGWTA